MQTVSESLRCEVEDLRGALVNQGVCPNCKETGFLWRDKENGEVVCKNCGYTEPLFAPLIRCSGVGNKQGRHDAPVNKLCFGDDLGNPSVNSRRNGKALFHVLGRNNRDDLGIRTIQIRNECMRSQENPITQRLKSYLSQWCKQFGWGDNVLLSNSCGQNAKWVGTILAMMNDGSHSKDLATAIFVLNVQKFFGKEKAGKVADVLKPKKLYVEKANNLIKLDKLVQ